jgi:hypothetical protein
MGCEAGALGSMRGLRVSTGTFRGGSRNESFFGVAEVMVLVGFVPDGLDTVRDVGGGETGLETEMSFGAL